MLAVLCQWKYLSNYVLIERCALSDMNREPYMLDETMWLMKAFNTYEKSLPMPEQLLMDRVNDYNEEDFDGFAANFARHMNEVTLAILDRITKKVERL